MNYTILGRNGTLAYIESDGILISTPQDALDLMVTVRYEKDCSKVILDKKSIDEELFCLSSGIAGEVLQKFVNYQMKLAVVGNFSKYDSKALRDFIYECNKGKDIFFVDSLELAVEKLDNV